MFENIPGIQDLLTALIPDLPGMMESGYGITEGSSPCFTSGFL
jgi:hypothetical protein